MQYSYQVYVMLEGGAAMLLCTVDSALGLGSIIAALAATDRPAFASIDIRIVPRAASQH